MIPKSIIRRKLHPFLCTFIMLLFCGLAYGQSISGPTPVDAGSTHSYTYNDGTIYLLGNWLLTGGTEVSSSRSGSIYTITVQWGGAGSGLIKFRERENTLATKSVTINSGAPTAPDAPDHPQVDNFPGYTVITRGTPPGGEIWYWQTSATGTSTANSALALTLYTYTPYYLRSYSTTLSAWSEATEVNYTITEFSNQNYLYTLAPRVPVSDASALTDDQKIESIVYYDGLGRPMQNVGIRAGGARQDVITHISYDGYGRQDKEYLPYALAGNNGAYKSDAGAATANFYDTAKYENTSNPYSQKAFDDSPLSRVIEQMAPGDPWKIGTSFDPEGHSNGHTIKLSHKSNTSGEVRRFDVSLSFANNTYTPSLAINGSYDPGTLYKTVTKDENWQTGDGTDHTTEEFKDKEGRVLLKRNYESGVAHDTYYVYDPYGNLSYVLPPLMDAHTETLGYINAAINELGYQYKYDHRNRLVEKRIPGKGDWDEIVYNKLDLPIMTRDANLKALNKWQFTLYDAFGRVAYTGMDHGNSSSRIALQNAANSASNQFETRTINSNTYAGTVVYYTKDAYPTSFDEVHAINYYDTYGHLPDYAGNTWAFGVPFTSNSSGLLVASEERILGTNGWNKSRFYYNDKGELTRTDTAYYNGAYQYQFLRNTFTGQVDAVNTYYRKNTSETYRFALDRYSFDFADRPVTTTHYLRYGEYEDVDSEAAETISVNRYNELGQVYRKDVGNERGASIQKVDYAYNVRGWLKEINDVSNLGEDLFAFKINYNTTEMGSVNDALFNGNISETIWRTANDVAGNYTRGYAYRYDDLNRITYADYGRKTTGAFNLGAGYDVEVSDYDKNGNIEALWRNGSSGRIDQLTYTYHNSGASNRLKSVHDSSGTEGFDNGANLTEEYTYDANGNMTADANKDISSISYNHLNLPEEIIFNSDPDTKINYLYSASGLKLKKTVTDHSDITTTEYLGNVVYKDGAVQFINHAEGYAEPNASDGTYDYVYQHKDHLGNIRMGYKGDYDHHAWDDFESGTDGWTAYGSGASVTSDYGRLKVTMTGMNTGAQRNITVPQGKRVKLSLMMHLGTTAAARVNFTIREYDAGGTLKTTRSYNNRWNIFNIQFTTAGTRIHIVAQKQSDDGQLTYFYLDDLEIKELVGIEIVEENNYYPFGLRHKGYNNVVNGTDHPYGYNGKEEQSELELNWLDYGWRNYDASLGRWMGIDNMAEKYVSNSPYHYADNNPIRNYDINGNEFTDAAWEWVNRVLDNINNRQNRNNEKNTADQQTLDQLVADGEGDSRKAGRMQRRIDRRNDENAKLETVRGEIATLDASDQVYDVVTDSGGTQSDLLGNSTTTNSTSYNFENGNIEITVSSGTSLGLFAHELKHAHQFEVGEISLGSRTEAARGYFLYDKMDELAGYQRGNLFGASNNIRTINDLPQEYNNLPNGPTSISNHAEIQRVLNSNSSQALKDATFNGYSRRIQQAFRVNGTTYNGRN